MLSDGSTQVFLVATWTVIFALAVAGAIYFRRRRRETIIPPQAQDLSQSPESFAVSSLFEATTGSMREGLLVVDKDMRVVASNPAAHKLFNSSLSKLNSQRLTELTRNPAIYSAFLDGLKGVERSGVKVQTHGPERQVFDLRVVPIGSGNGNGAKGALGVFFDITRLERLELVRQEFLSNVSHELRTPLTAILAFVETLETGALDDPESARRFLSIIRKNASRMHGLIDDILELTAIEGGNVRLRAGSVDLHSLVSDVCASLAAKAAANGVSLVNDVQPAVTVLADARRLEQMLTNLIDNGIKFSRDGGTVRISHERGERDKILVEDNGDGIPAQHLERLFERFYRVDRARSRDMGGTGLGLAIVKHLALLHGGEVTVNSELGKGTIFSIHLPKPPEN
ncbi:MAG TPA: ATP-binding protein [Pyrinomonadaceae bacterium]|nr:ATP-binding protein [Pyrinomonadaceae bacterium]